MTSPFSIDQCSIELLDRFARLKTNSFLASLLLITLLLFGLWSYLPHDLLLAWLTVVWAVQTAHEAYARYYLKHRGSATTKYRPWSYGFWLGSAAVGVCWNLPFLCLGLADSNVVVLLVFALAGVSAYGGVARAAVLSCALIFEFATVLPICIWLFRQDSSIHRIMGLVALLYLALLVPLLRKMNEMVVRTLRLDRLLCEREHEFRSLADSSPDFVVRYDRERRIRYLNNNVLELLGLTSASEIIGKRAGETGAQQIPKIVGSVIASQKTVTKEVLVTVAGGVTRYHHIHAVPEFGMDGTLMGVILYGRDVTDIREAEQRLRHYLEGIPGMAYTFRLTPDGRGSFPFTSQGIQELFGLHPEDVRDDMTPMLNLAHTDDRPRIEAALAESARTLTPLRFESRICRPGMPEKWIDVRSTPEPQPDGSMLWYGIMLDITERKQFEVALQEHSNLLHTIMESSPEIIIFALDMNYRYLSFNSKHRQVMQAIWGKEIAVGINMLDDVIGSPVDREVAKRSFDRTLSGESFVEESAYGDETLSREDWQVFWSPIRSNKGDITGLTCFVLNISERKRVEAKLRERFEHIVELNHKLEITASHLEERTVELEVSKAQIEQTEAWYRSIVRSAPDGMVVVDEQGRITLVNEHLESMFGYEQGELVGLPLETLLPPQIRAGHVVKRMTFFASGVTRRPMESLPSGLLACRKDGSEFPVDVSLSRLPESNGQSGVVCAAIRDVTERKRIEDALRISERESRTLLENSPDTIARYDRDCRRIYANPAFGSLVDGGVAALLGKTPTECPGGSGTDVYEAKIKDVWTTGLDTEFELTWTNKDGVEACSHIRLTAERSAAGEVESVLAVGRDITELHASRRKIHQMAFYDTLTALPNRALFNDRLRQMVTDSAWHEQQAGVMMMDMDRFKAINDTLGHPAGDELLREAATRLRTCVRAYDTVARLGGDEFAILLPDVRSGEDLGRVASKVIEAFQQPFLLEGKEVFVSCSIGIALYPEDSTGADDLLKYADSAMYLAKRSGRNGFCFYSRELTDSAHERLILESDLRRAIERKELALYYQPKVGLEDGRLLGSEALLRWNHPQRGLVPPDMFIGIAEDSGLIVEIGEWVLYQGCSTAHRWNGEGRPLHKVAINLSARQFQGVRLAQTVGRVLEETGCRGEWIELEITESLLLDEDGTMMETLASFRALGITVAIDDFGTGYSALSYLARFPIDTLKIDRSFVSHITTEHYCAELVKAILSIARSLGQLVVAEGVETPEQSAFLHAHGCQMAQGYFFGKPMPATEFEEKFGSATTGCSTAPRHAKIFSAIP